MYGLLGLCICLAIYFFVIKPIKIREARKGLVYDEETKCWHP